MRKFITQIPSDIPENQRWNFSGGRDGLVLSNQRMGLEAQYGIVYDEAGNPSHCQTRLVIESPSSVIVPYVKTKVGLLIGVLKDTERPIAGRKFDELPRGFSDKTEDGFETPLETASRELYEEGNLILDKSRFELIGGPFNMDTAWFEYLGDGGISIFFCEIFKNEMDDSTLEFIPTKSICFSCGISQMAFATFMMKYYKLI